MTTLTLPVPTIFPASQPLQRIAPGGSSRARERVLSFFFTIDLPAAGGERWANGWPIVSRVEPEAWPYRPEPGCREAWDAAGK